MARLSDRRRLVEVEEDEVDGIDDRVESESDDNDVNEEDDEDNDESEDELAVELGAERAVVAVISDSSGNVPNNVFCAGVR